MKNLFFTLFATLAFAASQAQNQNPNYDSTLASRLGGDEYGMKKYVFVILKTGTYAGGDKAYINKCFESHMANINKLAEEKKLLLAGPLGKNSKTYRGIFVLNTTSFEEAAEWLQADATISGNILKPEFFNWYGSAALPEYLEASDKIWKKEP